MVHELTTSTQWMAGTIRVLLRRVSLLEKAVKSQRQEAVVMANTLRSEQSSKPADADECMINTLMSEQPPACAADFVGMQADQPTASKLVAADKCIVNALMSERLSALAADCIDSQTAQSIADKPADADKHMFDPSMSECSITCVADSADMHHAELVHDEIVEVPKAADCIDSQTAPSTADKPADADECMFDPLMSERSSTCVADSADMYHVEQEHDEIVKVPKIIHEDDMVVEVPIEETIHRDESAFHDLFTNMPQMAKYIPRIIYDAYREIQTEADDRPDPIIAPTGEVITRCCADFSESEYDSDEAWCDYADQWLNGREE